MPDNTFELYDLTVVVEAIEGHCTCSMEVGDRFYLQGGKLSLPDGAVVVSCSSSSPTPHCEQAVTPVYLAASPARVLSCRPTPE